MTYGAKEDPLEACEVLIYWSFSTIDSCICQACPCLEVHGF